MDEERGKRRKSHHHDTQPRITKETLLKALEYVEGEVKELGHDKLQQRLKELRGQIKVVLQTHEEEIKNLDRKIQSLKEEVEFLKAKNKSFEKAFVVAEATWAWEAHLARFVVDSPRQIYKRGKFRQMKKYLEELNDSTHNHWTEIQRKLTDWTDEHWEVLDIVRIERNCVFLIDLDLVESEIKTTMSPESRKLFEDMLDMLKMTASLMKFGRLAKFCKKNKCVFPTGKMDALKCILSWDRKFDEEDGLQNIKHDEAKEYLAKYVGNPDTISDYYLIVDFIKDENSKRLGKLAWEFEKGLPNVDEISTDHRDALEKLKRLLPNPNDEGNVTVLDHTIAKLHIPDFLPKRLWKHGLEILEEYFE